MKKIFIIAAIFLFMAASLSPVMAERKNNKRKLVAIQGKKTGNRTARTVLLWNVSKKKVVSLNKVPITYCELTFFFTSDTSKYATVWYGKGKGYIIDPKTAKNNTPKRYTFYSGVEAVNWMERAGWMCFGSNIQGKKIRYMFKRRERRIAELAK